MNYAEMAAMPPEVRRIALQEMTIDETWCLVQEVITAEAAKRRNLNQPGEPGGDDEMLKKMEKADGQSCWNKADDDELVFILLARDVAAPAAIEAWCRERIRLGKNVASDHQITQARKCAAAMAIDQPGRRPK